jgi:hypothetical protein
MKVEVKDRIEKVSRIVTEDIVTGTDVIITLSQEQAEILKRILGNCVYNNDNPLNGLYKALLNKGIKSRGKFTSEDNAYSIYDFTYTDKY